MGNDTNYLKLWGNFSVCTNELSFLLPIFTLKMNTEDYGGVNLAFMFK